MEIRKLNMLRGLAALMVVFSHFSNDTGWLGGWAGAGSGQLGVMLFFILSGFLMAYLYLSRDFDRAALRRYVVARFARVVPLFLVVALGSYFLHRIGPKGLLYNFQTPDELWSHLLLLTGKSVLWTIPTEIHFYLVFLVLWWIGSRWREGRLFVLVGMMILAVGLFNFPLFQGEIQGLKYKLHLVRTLPYFLVGLCFGRLYTVWKAPDYLVHRGFVASLGLVLLLYPKIYAAVLGSGHLFWVDFKVLACLSAAFFAVVFLVPDDNSLLANRLGDFLGAISYSLYLLHLPVLWNLRRHTDIETEQGVWVLLVVFVGLAILVSYLSYRLIEKPCRTWIRRIA